MTREEALAPLKGSGEGRFPIKSGAWYRGQIRKLIVMHMLDYYEEKGFFESAFIVRGPADKIVALHQFLEENFKKDN
jgi:hypothetical protein